MYEAAKETAEKIYIPRITHNLESIVSALQADIFEDKTEIIRLYNLFPEFIGATDKIHDMFQEYGRKLYESRKENNAINS